jgi:squalene-associated FAD-dependent desaturase
MAAGRVAVVGAGLAGLAAGLDLADAGFSVEVFERSRLLGGRATSFVVDGIEVDNGQHVFLGCCTEFLRFVDRVGMSKSVHMQDRFDALVLSREGVASRLRAASLPAPWHLLASFIGYRHLAWPSKFRVAQALNATENARQSTGSFAQWLTQHGQTEESLRSFWRPFLVPALNAPLEEVSAADAAFVLSTAFLGEAGAGRFGYTTVPLAHVAAKAAARLSSVHLSTAVTGLWLSDDGSQLHGLIRGDGEALAFDAVILAVPPPQVTRIVGNLERVGLPPLDGYVPHPIVDVHLWHDREHLGFDFAAVLDSPVQWIFEKGSGYLCCSLSAADGYLDKPAAQISQECWNEVSAAVPALAGATLVRSVVTRSPEATYLAAPAQKRPTSATSVPNLTIAGSWTDTGWPDTMESAVRSGRSAARLIKSTFGGAVVA